MSIFFLQGIGKQVDVEFDDILVLDLLRPRVEVDMTRYDISQAPCEHDTIFGITLTIYGFDHSTITS